MRLFIAIHLEEHILEQLVRAQVAFKNYGHIRFPGKDNMHLTIKFLGDGDPEDIKKRLKSISFDHFQLELSNLGSFRDKILWASFKESAELSKLKREIDGALSDYKDDKPFKQHITLGRISSMKNKGEFLTKVKETKIESLQMTVRSFSLMNSELLPTGPRYSEIVRLSANF